MNSLKILLASILLIFSSLSQLVWAGDSSCTLRFQTADNAKGWNDKEKNYHFIYSYITKSGEVNDFGGFHCSAYGAPCSNQIKTYTINEACSNIDRVFATVDIRPKYNNSDTPFSGVSVLVRVPDGEYFYPANCQKFQPGQYTDGMTMILGTATHPPSGANANDFNYSRTATVNFAACPK